MKKKLVFIVCLALALLLAGFLVFRTTHRTITIVSGKQHVYSCPHFARPGSTVTVKTAVVADANLYVNGVEGRFERLGEFVFIMPDEDVNLKVTVISNNGA